MWLWDETYLRILMGIFHIIVKETQWNIVVEKTDNAGNWRGAECIWYKNFCTPIRSNKIFPGNGCGMESRIRATGENVFRET